jgi:acyl carrier protein
MLTEKPPFNGISIDALRDILIEELAAILHIEKSAIDTSRPFDEYGLDSTDAVIVVGVIEERVQAELDPELLLQHRTIDSVIGALIAPKLAARNAGV